jgi:hypothetical protein
MTSRMASMSVERPSGQKGAGELCKEVNIQYYIFSCYDLITADYNIPFSTVEC